MAKVSYSEVSINGLWKNNPVLVQILGLCPTLAVTSSVANALGLSLATTATLMLTNLLISLIRNFVKSEIRIPVYIIVIASVVTAIELSVKAYAYDLYLVLGIFLPLIVTNCVILGRAEAFASKNGPVASLLDGLMCGIGFTIVLCALGCIRELIGTGTLFDGMHLMFGEAARGLKITVISDYKGFLLAILPPGAFIGLGLLLAGKNIIDHRTSAK